MTHRAARRLGRLAVAVLVVLGSLAGCGSEAPPATSDARSAQTVTVALSWTPNTDYTGMYVAERLGLFRRAGIRLEIVPYASTAPENLISAGRVDFGFSYQAGVAYARAADQDVIGVFAPNARNTYAIGVAADNDAIRTPKDLDGKVYAGFGTPDEEPLLSYVIRRAGGRGSFENVTLNTSAYSALRSGRADFTIPVVTWAGIEARLAGAPMKYFKPEDYGFPTQYAVLLASSERWLAQNPELARRFIAAIADGYRYAVEHPQDAARMLMEANPSALPNRELVEQSEELLARSYRRDRRGRIGLQDPNVWEDYGEFLYDNGLLRDGEGESLTRRPDWSGHYTNALVPAT